MNDFEIFKYPLQIREHHLDTFGHVNNATYLQMLEEARWELLFSRGIHLKQIQEAQIGPVVLECHIKFLKEITLRQAILIESQMISYEKKVGLMRQDIWDEDNALCCQCKLSFGIIDMNTRKLIVPNEEWLHAVGIT
jgi:thioesterase-3